MDKRSSNRFRASKREQEALKKFGNRVRSLRKSKGLTLEQCEGLGFPSWRNLSDIENGQNCTLITRARIAKVLGVDIRDLF